MLSFLSFWPDWASWTQFGADGLLRSGALLELRHRMASRWSAGRVVDRGGKSVCMKMARGNSWSKVD